MSLRITQEEARCGGTHLNPSPRRLSKKTTSSQVRGLPGLCRKFQEGETPFQKSQNSKRPRGRGWEGRKVYSNLTKAQEELTEGPGLCLNAIWGPSESSSFGYNLLPSYLKNQMEGFHPLKLNCSLPLFVIVLQLLPPPYGGTGHSPLYSDSL